MSDNNAGKFPKHNVKRTKATVAASRKNLSNQKDNDALVNGGRVSSDRVSGLRNIFESNERNNPGGDKHVLNDQIKEGTPQVLDNQVKEMADPFPNDQMEDEKQGRSAPATGSVRGTESDHAASRSPPDQKSDMIRRQEREQASMLLIEEVTRKLTTCEHASKSKDDTKAQIESFMAKMLLSLQEKDEEVQNLHATQRSLRQMLHDLEERIEALAESNESLEHKTRDLGFQVAQTMNVPNTADVETPRSS